MAIVPNIARPWESVDPHYETPDGVGGGGMVGGPIEFTPDAGGDDAVAMRLNDGSVTGSYGQAIAWVNSAGFDHTFMQSQGGNATLGAWYFDRWDDGLYIWGGSQASNFAILAPTINCENGLVFKAAPTGQPPSISPSETAASDPNIDLIVKGKGTGVVETQSTLKLEPTAASVSFGGNTGLQLRAGGLVEALGWTHNVVWATASGTPAFVITCASADSSVWWIEREADALTVWGNSAGANFRFKVPAPNSENGFEFLAAPLGQSPTIQPAQSAASDPNIDMLIRGKGTGVVKTPDGVLRPWVQITQAAYNALSPPNANTLYVIVG